MLTYIFSCSIGFALKIQFDSKIKKLTLNSLEFINIKKEKTRKRKKRSEYF